MPWTKLGSEPVVITINTMECILKLKDGAQVRSVMNDFPTLRRLMRIIASIGHVL